MEIFDGKKLSKKILDDLAKKVKQENLKLKLGAVLVGKNKASEIFVREKEKACQKVGIDFQLFKFPSEISPTELKSEIKKVVELIKNGGVIIQLPLSKKFNKNEFLNLVPTEKDVDVLSEESIGRFYSGNLKISPPLVCAIKEFFKKYKIKIKGKNIVVIGAGMLVGKPVSLWLLGEKANFSVVERYEKNVSSFTKNADIIISGVGSNGILKGDMVKKGVIIIDAGISVLKGKPVGDIDFKSVSKKASYITPTIGGIGPMTVACLLKNLITLDLKK